MANTYIQGGSKADAKLKDIADKLSNPVSLNVGFLESRVATYAMINEYGATINREPSQVTVYRKLNAKGISFLRKGRFVRKSQSNFSSTHDTPAYTINIPSRPFFRNMIAAHKGEWGDDAAKLFKETDYDVITVAERMGTLMASQLQVSIRSNTPPPNAPSTIARKGHGQTLIDSGDMLNGVDFEIIS